MGRRKRTAEDYSRTAKENGWIPGAYEEEDRIQQTKDEPSRRYKLNQQEQREYRADFTDLGIYKDGGNLPPNSLRR